MTGGGRSHDDHIAMLRRDQALRELSPIAFRSYQYGFYWCDAHGLVGVDTLEEDFENSFEEHRAGQSFKQALQQMVDLGLIELYREGTRTLCFYPHLRLFRAGEDVPRPVVYFIRAGEDGPIKIGTTVGVERRVRELQTANPAVLRILARVQGGTTLERTLHARFAEHRLHGEWFEAVPDLLRLIDELRG